MVPEVVHSAQEEAKEDDEETNSDIDFWELPSEGKVGEAREVPVKQSKFPKSIQKCRY